MSPRLKSLELHGYKTFANRTLFEFPGPVTAIVGPNGSGKSNIADALRWVLGEQSYSLLRGKKTEDMIFAGSDQRPRAGMAQATVIFDNTDQWLPIEFSEVAVSRRAYRDGENEYFLNGQRVRLRDVHELLSQSGLSERTYTIIGQGLVDAALALKAEERRQLFEEAAGIGLHRSRREEALRRLETTRRNLERVEDILAELKPRLASLERQARRTREYEQVKADLQLSLREWYGYYWHRLQGELAQAREINRQQEVGLEAAGVAHAEIDQQLNGIREQILNLRLELNEWHRKSADLHTHRERINRDLAVREERAKYLEERLINTNRTLTQRDEEYAQLEERKVFIQAEYDRLTLEMQEAQSQAEVSRQSLDERLVERNSIEAEVDKIRKSLSDGATRQAGIEARQAERQSQLDGLNKSLQVIEAAISQGGQAVQDTETRLEGLRLNLSQAEQRLNEIETSIEQVQSHQSALEEQQKTRIAQRDQAQVQRTKINAQIEVIDQAEQTLTGYASGARLLIQAVRDARLQGAQSALSSQLQVPEQYETAIAAALGEYLDAVLLDSDSALESALVELEGKQARGALIPLDSLHVSPVASGIEPGRDVIGLASELILAPESVRPAVNLLLGWTIMVTDRLAARRMLKRLREKDQSTAIRIVTLRGEVFYANGAVLVAQEGKPGTLSRPRQKRELGDELTQVELRIDQITRLWEDGQKVLEKLKENRKGLAEAYQKFKGEEETARKIFQEQTLKLDETRRQIVWQTEQRQSILAQVKQEEVQLVAFAGQLTEIQVFVSSHQTMLKERMASLTNLPVADLQTEAAHWGMQAIIAERALEETHRRMKEQEHALGVANEAIKELKIQSEGIQKSRIELDDEKNGFILEESEISSKLGVMKVQIEPAETRLERLESDQVAQQAKEARARQTLNQAEHQHAQAKIFLARKQESLDALRRRIEDDFGLVAFEYAEEVTGPTPLPLEGMVEQLPRVTQISPEVDETIKRQKAILRRIGPINPEAQAEYREVKERYEFLTAQVGDLHKAEEDVREVIAELDALMQQEFQRTFKQVAEEFRLIFSRLFGGGSAKLVLTDPDDLTHTGIDIEARLPGRREQGLSLLSGGERSLTAVSLVFAILRVSPTPFCVLDEVDAMLDEANVGRFRDLLKELSQVTQFVIITHNRNTVQVADVLYGVTMGRDSSTQTLSLKMDEIDRVIE